MDDNLLLEIYKLFRAETHKSLELHSQHFGRFLTLVMAILGTSLAVMNYFDGDPFSQGIVSCAGGGFGLIASWIGKNVCDRFYEGMLEGISVTAKIEGMLNLEAMPRRELGAQPAAFPDDRYLLPERWNTARAQFRTSKEFIAASMKLGSNGSVRQTFVCLVLVSAGLIVYGVVRLYVAANP